MSEPLIRLEKIRFHYDSGQPVLLDADLTLNPGDRIGLIGATGGGKTSLLHLIVGLLHPSSGVIEVFGKVRKTEQDFVEVRRRVQLLFQDAEDQLFSPTVVEDVAFGPLNLGMSRDEALAVASETLETLGLKGFEGKVTHHLSGGQKRLVSLAAVLAMRPDVLLLDEPETGLDEENVERLVEILWNLPLAMIAVSHNSDFLRKMTTRIMYLHHGILRDEPFKP